MTRPQLMIWYEKTIKREFNERRGDIQARWEQTAEILAAQYNTAMGNKKKHKADQFIPELKSFEEIFESKETLIDQAKKLGLKTPSKKKI